MLNTSRRSGLFLVLAAASLLAAPQAKSQVEDHQLTITANSQTNCEIGVEVRQEGRFIARFNLAGYASPKLVLAKVQSSAPLDISVTPRNCAFRAYRVTTGAIGKGDSAIGVSFGDTNYNTVVTEIRMPEPSKGEPGGRQA